MRAKGLSAVTVIMMHKKTMFVLCLILYSVLLRHCESSNSIASKHTHTHETLHTKHPNRNNNNNGIYGITNSTIVGADNGCAFTTQYDTTSLVSFPMCLGQNNQDMKNGMSIINLIQSRGYLPTCRILHLLLWMNSEVHENKVLHRDLFVDIGSNIGSCSVHIASLGFPVVAAEPVIQHVNTIRGTIDLNPSFHIELHHAGIAAQEKNVQVYFGHGSRNWGASAFHVVNSTANETFETELSIKTFDQLVHSRKISLVKIDCEGCEWEALKGAKRSIKRIPIIKIELVQSEYDSGNTTVSSQDILKYLEANGFDLYLDKWLETTLYFGKRSNDILDIDKMFGSKKFKIKSDIDTLYSSARLILEAPVNASTFNRNAFLKVSTDIIAIERTLSHKMKKYFLH